MYILPISTNDCILLTPSIIEYVLVSMGWGHSPVFLYISMGYSLDNQFFPAQ